MRSFLIQVRRSAGPVEEAGPVAGLVQGPLLLLDGSTRSPGHNRRGRRPKRGRRRDAPMLAE